MEQPHERPTQRRTAAGPHEDNIPAKKEEGRKTDQCSSSPNLFLHADPAAQLSSPKSILAGILNLDQPHGKRNQTSTSVTVQENNFHQQLEIGSKDDKECAFQDLGSPVSNLGSPVSNLGSPVSSSVRQQSASGRSYGMSCNGSASAPPRVGGGRTCSEFGREAKVSTTAQTSAGAHGLSEDRGKREDGFKQRRLSRREGQASSSSALPRVEALCTVVEVGHPKSAQTLERRLHGVKAVRSAWAAGDVGALVATLEAAHDDGLAFSAFRCLQQHPLPLSPRSFGRLLPLAQRVAQSEAEDHAVAAMRFVLQALQLSWPTVAKALRQVGTPKPTWEACEESVSRISSLLAVVKAMARSVRVSRTSGPLVPVCRKLKTALEEALSAAGRSRAG